MLAPPGHLLLLTLVIAPALQVPPTGTAIPRVALETFPPQTRDAIARRYAEATSRPNDPAAAGELGRMLHAWEQWEAAHAAYARAATLAPASFDWPYLDAIVLQRLARHPEAAGALRRALAANSGYLPARVKLAEALLDAGELQESRKLFESLSPVAAAEPAALVGLGRIAAAEGRQADAVRHFERAIALFPELGAAHYGLARSYRALGRTMDAERAATQHARFGARWPRIDDPVLAEVAALREDARAALQRGVSLADAGDVTAAIQAHETALARDPALSQAHANLVGLYGRAQDWAKADEHFRAALARGFDNAEMQYDYGIVQGLQGRWDAAEGAYRKAVALNPLHAQARNNLGQVLERRRDFDGAAAEYRQAVDAQPLFRLARFNLGRMLLAKGETAQAVAELERLQQPVDAETPRYLFALSTAVVRAGRLDDGRRLGAEAQKLAAQFGQDDLARAIAAELAKLK